MALAQRILHASVVLLALAGALAQEPVQEAPRPAPDLAPRARITDAPRPGQPTIGMVSLGCPKALVDSERILTRLRADGYAMSADYAGADVVLVNTCGFLDSAKEESLAAIGEAIAENGRVIVTGCMGEEAETIRAARLALR